MSSFTTTDPTTGQPLERFERISRAELNEKIERADRAARAWASAPLEDRGELLLRVAKALRAQRQSLAETAVREMGKPVTQARAEVEKCAWCCEHFAQAGPAMLADDSIQTEASRSYAAFRPLGVVLAVMPWNFPYWQVIRAAAPALMAGNAMVLKHAENTTQCGLELERLFRECGAPEGLFTALISGHDDIGATVADPRISAVTLTGSERAGIAIATAAGAALKKCVLELGGSDAFIVLADADLDATAAMAVKGRFQNNGQSCIAAKRFIVENSVHDEFLTRFVAAAKAQRMGNPMDDATEIGPMARADLRDEMHRQVMDTAHSGAKVVLGGRAAPGNGFFYEPTIVDAVEPAMAMFDEEIFGPAAAVIVASDADHAIDLANLSRYGLGSSIWTRDTARAQQLAGRIEAGSVFVNGIVASDPRLPFGGVKKSGYGRELSTFGIHEFVNIQTVWVK
ncbi:MAG: NAD-dependent succinate-semialdehyde dehydrogenase [Candidatus Baltobacteraceae bacterium]